MTRAELNHGTELPTRFIDSSLASRAEFEASLRLPDDERRAIESSAARRAQAERALNAAVRQPVAREGKDREEETRLEDECRYGCRIDASEQSGPSPAQLIGLPPELLHAILSQSDCVIGICSVAMACKILHEAIGTPSILRELASVAMLAEYNSLLGLAYNSATWHPLKHQCRHISLCPTIPSSNRYERRPCQRPYTLSVDVMQLDVDGSGDGRRCWVGRVHFVETPSAAREGYQVLCYQLRGAYEGDDAFCKWVLLRWPSKCVTPECFLPSICDEIEAAVVHRLVGGVARPCTTLLDDPCPLHASLLDWQRRKQALDAAGMPIYPSVRTSHPEETAVVTKGTSGRFYVETVELWHGMACRSSRIWSYTVSNDSGYDPTMFRDAVATGGLGRQADLLAIGSSTCDGDDREEPHLWVHHLHSLVSRPQ